MIVDGMVCLKNSRLKPVFFKVLPAAMLLFVAVAGLPAYCQNITGYALMIQQSPAEGGIITPQSGVHRVGLNESMTVTAIPNPGYRFVYWLGDVSEPDRNQTTIIANAPKIVIAVFERTEYDMLVEIEDIEMAGGGGGLLRSSAVNISGAGSVSGGGGGGQIKNKPREYTLPDIEPDIDEEEEDEDEDEFLLPDESDDLLVPDEPIPEPATIALLGLGSLAVLLRRKSRQITA